MRASVVYENDWVEVGETIEVLGFVYWGTTTWAVWRDDEGALSEIPTSVIRMQPAVEPVEP